MNKNLRSIVDKVRFVDSPEYPDQDQIFERFAEGLIIEIIGRIYSYYPKSRKAEKLVEEICYRYGFGGNK